MDGADQFGAKRLVNHAVACNPGLTGKSVRPDNDVEMALATFLKTGMAAVAFAVVSHSQFARGKSVAQTCLNLFCSGHFFASKGLPLRRFGLHSRLRVEKGRL